MSYRQAQEFQVQQQQLAQRLADLRANPPATLSPQQLAEWDRLTQRSGQAARDAVNHLEGLRGVRMLFGAKGDEMTAGLLEQISQSNLTAEQIAVLTQNLDDYPWLLEKLNAKPEQVRTWTVKGAGRFIAKTGNELKTYLNGLVNKPLGKTYNGSFFKSVSKNAELNHNAKPDIISQYSIEEVWGRYDVQGESAMYYSKTLSGNQTEMSHYGDWNSYSTYEFNNVQIDNVLDLTDEAVRQQLGSEFHQLVLTIGTKSEMYEFTNTIGTWAREKGYKGVIVPGARGSKNYTNIVVFNQPDLTISLNGITPIKLK